MLGSSSRPCQVICQGGECQGPVALYPLPVHNPGLSAAVVRVGRGARLLAREVGGCGMCRRWFQVI